MTNNHNTSAALFRRITAHPKRVVAVALLAILVCGAGLSKLVKDTSVKAFIPAGHESLQADDKAAEVFGLSDTITVAVIVRDGGTVFTPEVLSLIDRLTASFAGLPNIRYDRVASLATESSIAGDGGNVLVESYVAPFDMDDAFARSSRERWRRMRPHIGTLVSSDETGAIVMGELIDPDAAAETYQALADLVATLDMPGVDLHVAGPAAVSGYLSEYIDNDARKLQPLVVVLVIGFVFLAFRRWVALPGPLLVVIGSTGSTLGLMSWAGIPYYAITNALPVIIVAISVADSIHILSAYYQLREQHDDAGLRELVVHAMSTVARPITLTTITTIAGFSGIAAMSIMPPITWFAVCAALGVFLAWCLSIFVLPNMLLLVRPARSPAFATWRARGYGSGRPMLARIGAVAAAHHARILLLFALVSAGAIYGASQLRIDRSQVENFAPTEPIRIADELINATFAGTAFLDIIVEADDAGGLLTAENMGRIRDLQASFEALPHVRKTVSIVDYVGQLHGALEGLPQSAIDARPLPDTDALVAEALHVYEITGDPGDLEEEIDADFQHALIRGMLDAHHFSETRPTVESLQRYIDTQFNGQGLTASLAGDVNVTYHWMTSLRETHFASVALSLALVLAASSLVFRSLRAGLVSAVPVVFTVLVLYACMGYLGIYLEPATSMFAAIALGVGVDFAIHLVDRLRASVVAFGGDLDKAIRRTYAPVARACLFNSAALGLGFSVLLASDLPTLTRFGGLVALASFSSYLVALIVIPALFAVRSRWFRLGAPTGQRSSGVATLLVVAVAVLFGLLGAPAVAGDSEAVRVAAAVANRDVGAATQRIIDMTLEDRRGRTEQRRAIVHKQRNGTLRQTRITFVEPKKYEDMTFLSYDYRLAGRADERWMYLPVSRRVRSIPASRRGSAFFGTDFSYEDMQSELKFRLSDWHFAYGGAVVEDGRTMHRLSGQPKDDRTARELGYGGFTALVDETTWIPVHIEFVDPKQRRLKTIDVSEIQRVGDIWTPGRIVATNHRTGHRTEFRFRDTRFPDALDDRLFDAKVLARGLPHGYRE